MENLPLAPRKDQALAIVGPLVSSGAVATRYPAFAQEKVSGNPVIVVRQFLRRWKWTLILSTLAGTLAGVGVTALLPTVYEARATLEVQDPNDTFLNLKQFLPVNESGGPANTYGDIQTQIKFLQSDSILQPVAARMPAVAASSISNLGANRAWAFGPTLSPNSYVQRETRRLMNSLKVRAVGQTRIIELTAESTSPELAADFLNQVCAEYIDKNIKARFEMGQHTSRSLAHLLTAERLKLRESEDALQQYAKSSGLLFTSANKSAAEEKLNLLQEELSKAEENLIAAQSRYEVAQQSSTNGLPDELTHGSVRDYKSKLTQLREQLAQMSATYTANYYKVKQLEAQIAELKSAVKEEGQDVLEQVKNGYDEALRHQKLLASDYAKQEATVSELAQRAVQYNVLERELEANRQSYDEMLKQVNEATVAAAVRTDNVRVVDEAVPPKQRHSPKPLLNCALGILLGSSFGFFVAFVREGADLSLREPGDANQYLGVVELGSVVHVHVSNGKRRLLRRDLKLDAESQPTVESYRAIVASLLSEANREKRRCLVVTSPGPGEGKTTVTANLGLMLAAIGRRVVLVDGDLRKPRLNKIFGIGNEHGLSTLLEVDDHKKHNVTKLVQRTSTPRLSVLTSGPLFPASADLLHSAALQTTIEALKKEYDFILIDTPPVLPLADARVIGALADGVIFVVRARETRRDAMALAHHRLNGDGLRVLGVILNDWEPASSEYNYYAPYGRRERQVPPGAE